MFWEYFLQRIDEWVVMIIDVSCETSHADKYKEVAMYRNALQGLYYYRK